jgi:secreted PhoX family phosphatase
VDRRAFLRTTAYTSAAVALAPAFWQRAIAGPRAASPYGAPTVLDADTGLLLPPGFQAREIVRAYQPVGPTAYVWRQWPDGAATFPTADGGWIFVSNSEVPVAGGVDAMRFSPDGEIVGAYPVLAGTSLNCAGGTTPWGTWLSCEEWDGGLVWECDPTGPGQGVARPALGSFKHEAAAVDPVRGHVYLTEDQSDGCFYRFTPAGAKNDLASGTLEVMVVGAGNAVSWKPVPNPNPLALPEQSIETPTREQVPDAARFDGGEGCFFDSDIVYFTTKGDHRVWALDVAAQTLQVLYDGAAGGPLRGVDNLIVNAAGEIFVAEDGDDMQVCIVGADGTATPFLQMTGSQHTPGGQKSEVTGLAFSPDGTRLYCSSQRGAGTGITYEVTGPFTAAAASRGSRRRTPPR